MSSDKPAIRIQGLSKCFQIYATPKDRLKQFVMPRLQKILGLSRQQYFEEFWALEDISFEIQKGETIGIVGKNGSGKSTLLQIICGILKASSGSVETNGRIAALLELGSGFNPEFTGRENVYINAAIFGLKTAEIDARYNDIVAFADIGSFIEQPIKTYSTGMMMRLAFAVAINVDPQILIIDEALSVGDELFQRKCFSKIQSIKEKGSTILFVSHSGGTVIELCDRALLLYSGKLLLSASPKSVVSKYQRLLNASEKQQFKMLNEIRSHSSTLKSKSQISYPKEATILPAALTERTHNFLDPNLKSQSSLEYPSTGALITAIQLLDLKGEPINIIKRGQEYIYRYQVSFEKDSFAVRAGTILKTVSGLELGGMQSHTLENSIKHIKAGGIVQFSFRFKCILLPGVYFFNAGVVSNANDEELYLHRIIDALTFRVVNEKHLRSVGIIDFSTEENPPETIVIAPVKT